MATVNFGWVTPTVGASTDTWGTILNSMFDDIDTDVFAIQGTANAALARAGGTMTGALVLSGAPTIDLHAATKLYVDTADALKLNLSGGTMTGTLVARQAATASVTDSSAAGAVTLDCQDGNVFKTVLSENITSIATSNPIDGQTICWRIKQAPSAGPYTVSWPASFLFPGGANPSVSTAAGAVDLLVGTYFSDDAAWICTLTKAHA